MSFTRIFPTDDGAIEHSVTADEVQAMDLDVADALRFIPGRHSLIVATDHPARVERSS
jgi:hypothetical protein